jgi:response regulator RpfG family c-di-GMP phosphodiesterase
MINVLLLEPDKILAKAYAQALDDQGYNVLVSNSAQSAIMVADQQKPDVVIIEIQLVEHSGIEFLYELRSYYDWQDIPVIINSFVPSHEFNNSQKTLKDILKVKHYHNKSQTTITDLLKVLSKFWSE